MSSVVPLKKANPKVAAKNSNRNSTNNTTTNSAASSPRSLGASNRVSTSPQTKNSAAASSSPARSPAKNNFSENNNNDALIEALRRGRKDEVTKILARRDVVIARATPADNNSLVQFIAQTQNPDTIAPLLNSSMLCTNTNLFLNIYQEAERLENDIVCKKLSEKFKVIRSEQEKFRQFRQQIIDASNPSSYEEDNFNDLLSRESQIAEIINEKLIRQVSQFNIYSAVSLIRHKYIQRTMTMEAFWDKTHPDFNLFSWSIYEYIVTDPEFTYTADGKDFFAIACEHTPHSLYTFSLRKIDSKIRELNSALANQDFTVVATPLMNVKNIFKFVLISAIKAKRPDVVTLILNEKHVHKHWIDDAILNPDVLLPADETMRTIIGLLLNTKYQTVEHIDLIKRYLELYPNCEYQDKDGKTLFDLRDSQELKTFCEQANKILTAKIQSCTLNEAWVCKELNIMPPPKGEHIKLKDLLQRYVTNDKWSAWRSHREEIAAILKLSDSNEKALYETIQEKFSEIEIKPQGTLAVIIRYVEETLVESNFGQKFHNTAYAYIMQECNIKALVKELDPGPQVKNILTQYGIKPLFSISHHEGHELVGKVLTENPNASAQDYYIALMGEIAKQLPTTINSKGLLAVLLDVVRQLAIKETMMQRKHKQETMAPVGNNTPIHTEQSPRLPER